ncbi:hypothetical protein H0G86_004785 [Trichoderma simmonsii]|uniref:Secreted protein n=1 Tax=Trichoderma simmonsii TaxID=1491479 RepID=A0A8G0LB91_9HYPO|nr:hypothetical protein H0G86_004785 [Trichoderma simmonsii]
MAMQAMESFWAVICLVEARHFWVWSASARFTRKGGGPPNAYTGLAGGLRESILINPPLPAFSLHLFLSFFFGYFSSFISSLSPPVRYFSPPQSRHSVRSHQVLSP